MVLYKDTELKVLVGDIETIRGLTDLGFYNPDTKEWHEFQMSKYRNDLYSFVKFYKEGGWDYVCGYNYKNFDAQVIQHIIENHQKWFDLSGEQIAEKVHDFTQRLLDDQSYDLFSPYKEHQFSVKVIDVYLIFGLDNEARRSSLKKCEFQIDYSSVEEMPIHHSKVDFTPEEVQNVLLYRRNDVLATLELLNIALGRTEHPIYKGNNQIDLRVDLEKEFGIKCLNYSDIKIGDEILKLSYANAVKKPIHELPRKGTFRKTINLRKCIPLWVDFETPILKELYDKITKMKIGQLDSVENKFKFYGTNYVQALGGLHSENKNEVFEENDEFEIHDYDVASMYPAIIVNNQYYPAHLGIELLKEYTTLYHKRLDLKPLSKKDKRIKGIVEGLKLALNAVFGKLGSMESWLYDKQALLSTTLTGQFCLLMLIELYETNGFHVISANTDGVTVLVKKDRIEHINKLNQVWMNKTSFLLEKARYKKIIYQTVNDYIAVTFDEKTGEEAVKVKGDFIKNFELWKNKSARVIPMALEAYFIHGTNPVDFITNHQNIYDFCIMARAVGKGHLEEQWEENNEIKTKKHKKLIRYYLSDQSNKQLYRRGIGTTGKNMNTCLHADNALGRVYTQYFNQFEDKQDYGIAHKQYILKALERIDNILKTKMADNYINKFKTVQQTTLF